MSRNQYPLQHSGSDGIIRGFRIAVSTERLSLEYPSLRFDRIGERPRINSDTGGEDAAE